jgi:hypothetical protein
VATAVECLTPHDPNELGILPEKSKSLGQNKINLRPSNHCAVGGGVDTDDPAGEGSLEYLSVDRILRREVMKDTRATNSHSFGDVIE